MIQAMIVEEHSHEIRMILDIMVIELPLIVDNYFTSYFHKKMKYANIKKYDVSNGVGVRVSLFVSGCRHHCKGCFNAEAWDFNYGTEFTQETIDEIIESLKPDYINGLSLL